MKEKFPAIYKEPIETLQINIGYKCNQACKHCHVNSSPLRTEKMSNEMISLIPKIIEKYKIKTLDITGGAPELHPDFKKLITSLSTKKVDIMTLSMGSGSGCDGQYLFANDVLGYTQGKIPRHARIYRDFKKEFAKLQAERVSAFKEFHDDTVNKKFNDPKITVNIDESEFEKFLKLSEKF